MMLWRGLCKEGIQLCMLQAHRCAGTYSGSSLKDYYQVLGVGRKATSEEIKSAFFTMSKKCHPDSDPKNPLLHSQFVRLNEAYRVLNKHSSRMEYDKVLEAIQRENWSSGRSRYKSSSTSYNWNQSSQTHQEPFTRSTYEDRARYWSQFAQKEEWKESSAEEREQSNIAIVLYCILVASLSIFVHYELFRSFRDIRQKELDEEQMKILKFYNDRKETARVNGFSMQQEILVKKHEERLSQLYGRKLKDETTK